MYVNKTFSAACFHLQNFRRLHNEQIGGFYSIPTVSEAVSEVAMIEGEKSADNTA